jgi:hypothetical protein
LKKNKLNYIKTGTKRTQHHRSTPPLNPTAAAPDSSIKRTQQHHSVIEPAFKKNIIYFNFFVNKIAFCLISNKT